MSGVAFFRVSEKFCPTALFTHEEFVSAQDESAVGAVEQVEGEGFRRGLGTQQHQLSHQLPRAAVLCNL